MHVRKRLVVWQAGALAGLLLLFSMGLYGAFWFHLNAEVDEVLISWSDRALGSTNSKGHPAGSSPPESRNQDPARPVAPDSFTLLLNEKGQLFENASLESKRILAQMGPSIIDGNRRRKTLQTLFLDGEPYRIRIMPIPDPEGSSKKHTLIVGRSLTHVTTTLSELGIFLVLAWLMAVSACTGVSWLFVGKTLAPVKRMTRDSLQLAESGQFGRRIDFSGQGDEFAELARALNRMLVSLESSSVIQKKFLADSSHELRTPLTSVKANLDFIRRARGLSQSDLASALDDMAAEVDRMASLVNQLLMLARSDAAPPVRLETTDLAQIVRDALLTYRQHPALRNRAIDTALPECSWVRGDPEALRQLVIILLDNALKYSPERGCVRISLGATSTQVVLEISDDGPGIPPEELPKVFDRFYRASNVRGSVNGSGLGLAIAQSIIARHEGRLHLQNRAPHGVTASVALKALL